MLQLNASTARVFLGGFVKRFFVTALFMTSAMVGLALMSAPASARTYWCKDGTAVTYTSSCKSHGGCCQSLRKPLPVANGRVLRQAEPNGSNAIFDRWGNLKNTPAKRERALPKTNR
jgi:hypothetical protein